MAGGEHNVEGVYEMVEKQKAPPLVQLRHDQDELDPEQGNTSGSGVSNKYHTAPPSYFDKIKKSFREKMHGVRESEESIYDVVQKISDELCPVDFSDSFDADEQLAVRIGRDGVKYSIMEMMRDLRGDIKVLTDIEEGSTSINLKALTCEERQVVMLFAAFYKRKDILEQLLARKDCNLQTSTPDDCLSALHLAAYSGCQDCINLLLKAGAKMTHKQSYSPLHCAALSANLSCVQVLLTNGAKVDSKSEDLAGETFQDTPLHCAIKSNSPECVKKLLQAGANPSALGQGGLSPLHVASDLTYLGCMRALLEFAESGTSKMDINQITQDGRGFTALHLVTEDQFADGIRLLKEYKVNCNAKSAKGMTALHLACREQSIECAKLLIDECDVNEMDNEGRTPLHLALGRSEAADIANLLVHIPGIQVNKVDKYGFTPLHVAAVNEQARAAEILIKANADLTARTSKGSTALRMVIRKVPAALYAVEEVMDSSISLNNNMDSRDVELKLDFKPLLASKKRITTDLLNTFIAEGRPELLQHPLCQAFLHIKWQEVRIFYIMRLVYYLAFLFFVSVYVIAFLSNGCTDISVEMDEDKCGDQSVPISFKDHSYFLKIIYRGLIWVAIFEGLRKIYGLFAFCAAPTSVTLRSSLQIYLCQIDNWLEWCCLVCVLIFTGSSRKKFHIYIGAMAVLTGWSNLMILFGQLPYFGAYVAMYTCVLREMGKLLMAYLCMLIGFTVSFYVVFREKAGFSNFWQSIVKILVMMTGELEFNDLFSPEEGTKESTTNKPNKSLSKNDGSPRFPDIPNRLFVRIAVPNNDDTENSMDNIVSTEIIAYIVFTLFLLFVTVVLMNLLVGIAVHDISGLRTTAVISRLQSQADLIGYIETALPNFCTLRCCLCCCFCCLQVITNRKTSAGRRRRRTDVGVLSVRPHHMTTNALLPREIVSVAFEVAKKMNPYKGNAKSTKAKPRYKRIYSKQHSGSIYETIIPRSSTSGNQNLSINRRSQYLCVDRNVDNSDANSIHSDLSCRTMVDEIKELKQAIAQQNVILQQLLQANRLPPPLPPPSLKPSYLTDC